MTDQQKKSGLILQGIITEIGTTKKGSQRVYVSLGKDTVSILTEKIFKVGEWLSMTVNSFEAGQLYSESI